MFDKDALPINPWPTILDGIVMQNSFHRRDTVFGLLPKD